MESLISIDNHPELALQIPIVDRFARNGVRRRLAAIEGGAILVEDWSGSERFGERHVPLDATIRVKRSCFYRAVAARGALGAAEAFMEGDWETDDLTGVIRLLARNQAALERLNGSWARLARPSLALFHALRRNTRSGSKRNIAAHYDLGNDFFELFLDPSLTYSAGVFDSKETTMEAASAAKYDRICRKLELGPQDHVLEIGTGWGGFALHAAGRFGCRVTTTTISQRQYELARRRVAEAGLGSLVEVLRRDYRDLRGDYDKIVSIEMIEAVGHQHLDEFFATCGRLLRADGMMAIQAITIPDRHYEAHTRSVDFIKRYIFPGSDLVSLGAVSGCASESGAMRLTHWEDITPHYAETLRRWRTQMFENIAAVRSMGLDERFIRMWEYYLCYCEGGFEERAIGVAQAVFEKSGARRPSVLGDLKNSGPDSATNAVEARCA
jgi:cyclopropane-fatty-acyl-phospholipid synthase